MKLSKYVTRYDIDGYSAYYHSLRMKPVFLSLAESIELETAIKENRIPKLEQEILESLKEYLIVVDSDQGVLEKVQQHVPEPYISVAYFVLSEQCNLACKYCFLGNSNVSAAKICKEPMSYDTADKALDFFARQTRQDMDQFDDEKEIIFYGGEPLINFETLKYVVARSKYYQEQKLLSDKLKFSIITNGILLNAEKIEFLKENNVNVSISIDGAREEQNVNRVDKNGKPVYSKIFDNLLLAKQMGLDFGLSITLSEEAIKDIDSLIAFIERLEVYSICFYIILQSKDFSVDEKYYVDATSFIIDFYEKTIDKGIYEDRFMRKLKAFAESGIYFSDCAATSGSQIVITPDGNVGICHGTMENREFFIGNVADEYFIVADNDEIKRWCKLTPVFKEECVECPALGICGGGCPINAREISKTRSIEEIDRAFCIHAKNTLEYLIKKLLHLMLESNGKPA